MTLGDVHQGQFNLGPVDWSESMFHNSCSPYPAEVQQLEGTYLAGVSNDFNGGGALCDACIQIVTGTGRQLVARVVTTGVTQSPGDVDLSPEAFAALDTGEYPRAMTWQLVSCPTTDAIRYQFQTGANPYWTSLWVRNPRLPVDTLEVKSANHADWFALQRGGDGTFTDSGGFGDGAFMLRVTASDGSQLTDSFPSFTPGGLMPGSQF
jgi:expansin (peptidoglycan-binding protein)